MLTPKNILQVLISRFALVLVLFMATLNSPNCNAQDQSFQMTTGFESYFPLDEPISVNSGETWNEGTTYPLYFNFPFKVLEQSYTALNVLAGGGISFPGLGEKILFVYHTPFGGYFLKDKGINVSESPISYQIVGVQGNRILKIEWRNAGFTYPSSSLTDYVDFQVWLYEDSNLIQIHFGPNQSTPESLGYPEYTSDVNPGPSIKWMFDDCSNILAPTGPADLPSYVFFDSCFPNYYFIDGIPSQGIVYSFIPQETTGIFSTNTELAANAKLFPSPFKTSFTVELEENVDEISVYNSSGQIIKSINGEPNNSLKIKFNLENQASGIYFVKLRKDNKLSYLKAVKQD